MFSLLNRHIKADPTDLLTSKLYTEKYFYQAFIKDLKHCKEEVIIESPYLTPSKVAMLQPTLLGLLRKGVRVRVNTRYPGHHDELLRIQAWRATKTLKQLGVKVRFFNNYLHRKVAVIDNHILWEGSLNILSHNNSCEIMRRIESEPLAQQMVKFLGLKRFYW